jgi:hypothetical protein
VIRDAGHLAGPFRQRHGPLRWALGLHPRHKRQQGRAQVVWAIRHDVGPQEALVVRQGQQRGIRELRHRLRHPVPCRVIVIHHQESGRQRAQRRRVHIPGADERQGPDQLGTVDHETSPVVVKTGGKVCVVEPEVCKELCQPFFHLKA